MTEMLNLHDVLELVDDGLNHSKCSQEYPIHERHELVLHVLRMDVIN